MNKVVDQKDSVDELPRMDFWRPKNLDSKEYNRLIQAAELEDIRLMKSEFFIVPKFFDQGIADDRNFNVEDSVTDPEFDKSTGKLFSVFEYAVWVDYADERLLSCKATYLAVFSIVGEFELDLLKYFASRIGRNASYPYFRDHAAQQSWASGAQLPILPIMKTGSAKKPAAEVSGSEV